MSFFAIGHLVNQDDDDAVVILIENGLGRHYTVASTDADISIRSDFHGTITSLPPAISDRR